MASMSPPEWEDINNSHAEAHIYRRLRDDTPEDWYGIHSLGLTTHSHKSWAEIDFVVVGPFGVLCIEVKGGRVTVEQNHWSTNGHQLRESPFAQAGGGAAALRRELRDRFPALNRALVEYAVAFPDVHFDAVGPGMEQAIIYDERTVGLPIRQWFDGVVAHWRERKDLDSGRFRPLSRSERSAIVSWLAPSIASVPSLRARIAESEAELVKLTQLQARTLRGMRTKQRALIRGGAGTGKTLLAVEEASRLATEGTGVLFCCRSALLAEYLRTLSLEELVQVRDMKELMTELVAAGGRTADLPDASDADLFSVFLPEAAAEAALDLQRNGSIEALVVDEAQDLMFEGALDLFDVLLDGGLDEGTWRVFVDHKQNVFSAVDLEQAQRLARSAITQHDLVDNCRNTPEIATMTALLAAVTLDEALANDGPEVDLKFVESRGQEFESIAAVYGSWLERGIAPQDIVLLGDRKDPPSELLRAMRGRGPVPVPFYMHDGASPGWCPVEDFKGLESPAVIVTGVSDLETTDALRRVYVACSRARTMLGVFIAESAHESFLLRATEFARRDGLRGAA